MKLEEIRESKDGTSIVFVHGVLSSGQSGWTNKNKTYWPSLLLDEASLRGVGLHVFTYKTGVFSGSYRLSDAVDSLKELLDLNDLLMSKRIVFVCHSMGGILVRKYLVERSFEIAEKGINIGLFLIASPSLGSDYASWISPLARILGHSQADALRFTQSNSWLMDLDKDFMNLKERNGVHLVGKELIEDNFIVFKKFLRKQIVPPFSGAKYFGEPFKVPNSDHFSICKPENANAIQHRLLLRFISQLADQQEKTISAPIQKRMINHGPKTI